jgi:hypothetical protein
MKDSCIIIITGITTTAWLVTMPKWRSVITNTIKAAAIQQITTREVSVKFVVIIVSIASHSSHK